MTPLNMNLRSMAKIAVLAAALGVSLVSSRAFGQQTRVLRARNGGAYAGQQLTVPIELVALGNENAVGFSLSFNQQILTNAQVATSGLPTGTQVNINMSQVAQGRIGIALALPAGQKLAAGTVQFATVTFVIAANATNGRTAIAFGDQPVVREVSNDLAQAQVVNFTPATVFVNPVTSESAAGGKHVPAAAAPDSIVAGFGLNLTNTTAQAATVPLPTILGGVSLTITDSTGTDRLAGLLFVSPGQINYVVPTGTATGPATVRSNFSGTDTFGALQINAIAPALFTANQNGEGVPSAYTLRVKSDGSQTQENVFDASPTGFVPRPIDLDPPTDSVFIILFGTGIRGRTNLSDVTATIGGVTLPVQFADKQSDFFVGLDQVNVLVSPPQTLKGRGTVDVIIKVAGATANTVQVNFK